MTTVLAVATSGSRMRRVDVDLVAQPLAERVDDRSSVVSGPVEPAVHDTLDATAERLEQRERDERGGGHRERALLGHRREHRLEPDDEPREHGDEDPRHDRPPDRAADEPVDLVQPVAEDRDARWSRAARSR